MKLLIAILAATSPPAPTQKVPEPPPLITDCFTPGPWIVFFAEGSVVLDADSKSILNDLIRSQRDDVCGGFSLAVTGHTDRGERVALARRRAAAARTYLREGGVTSPKISVRGMGAREPRIPNRGGVAELQNRRVEVNVTYAK